MFVRLAACLSVLSLPAFALETISLNPENWEIAATDHRFEKIDGIDALFLENGAAALRDFQFENGVIEYDVQFPEQRGFVGVHFRMQDAANYEDFYIRPHQSGNPDANQYTPVFNGVAGWQIYYGPQYATPVEYRYNEWVHVKLVVSGDEADIYIDSDEPVLHVSDLKRDQASGGVALWTNIIGARFANLKISRQDNIELTGTPAPAHETPAGLIEDWSVSTPVAEASLTDTLSPEMMSGLEWTHLETGSNGVANIARAVRGSRDANTALVRVVINSDTEQRKRMRFGFSDRVKLYLNGEIIFDGDDLYGSRDYRHLGTVGFYDAVHLPLKDGDNEIILAVSESFGGWAAAGAIEDRSGISVSGGE